MTAFSRALALESASDSTYDEDTGIYVLTHNELVRYAKIVAYKVVHNMQNGHELDPDDDPLTYVDCGGGGIQRIKDKCDAGSKPKLWPYG